MNKIKQFIFDRLFKDVSKQLVAYEDDLYHLHRKFECLDREIDKLKVSKGIENISYRDREHDKIIRVSYTFDEYRYSQEYKDKRNFIINKLFSRIKEVVSDSIIVFEDEGPNGIKYTASLRVGHTILRNEDNGNH